MLAASNINPKTVISGQDIFFCLSIYTYYDACSQLEAPHKGMAMAYVAKIITGHSQQMGHESQMKMVRSWFVNSQHMPLLGKILWGLGISMPVLFSLPFS